MAIRIPGVRVSISTDTGIIQNAPYNRFPVIMALGDPYLIRDDIPATRGTAEGDASAAGDLVRVNDSAGVQLKDSSGANVNIVDVLSLGAVPGLAGSTGSTIWDLSQSVTGQTRQAGGLAVSRPMAAWTGPGTVATGGVAGSNNGHRAGKIPGIEIIAASYSNVEGPGILQLIVENVSGTTTKHYLRWHQTSDDSPLSLGIKDFAIEVASGTDDTPSSFSLSTGHIAGRFRIPTAAPTTDDAFLIVQVTPTSLPSFSDLSKTDSNDTGIIRGISEIIVVGDSNTLNTALTNVTGVTSRGISKSVTTGDTARIFFDYTAGPPISATLQFSKAGTADIPNYGATASLPVGFNSAGDKIVLRLSDTSTVGPGALFVEINLSSLPTSDKTDGALTTASATATTRTRALFDPINTKIHWDPQTTGAGLRVEGIDRPKDAATYYARVVTGAMSDVFEPTLYQDESDLLAEHGAVTLNTYTRSRMGANGLLTNPEYVNPLVAAASLCFDAGALGVITARLRPTNSSGAYVEVIPGDLDLDTSTTADGNGHKAYILYAINGVGTIWEGLFEKLEKITNAKLYLIPLLDAVHSGEDALSGTQGLNELVWQHCVNMSAPRSGQETTERTCIGVLAPVSSNATIDTPIGRTQTLKANGQRDPSVLKTYIDAFNSTRFMCMAPEQITPVPFQNAYHNGFAAAVYGALLSKVAVGASLTDDEVPGISLLPTINYKRAEVESLLQAGATVLKQEGSSTRIVMALTTDVTDAVSESANIQEIGDYLRKQMRDLLWAKFKKIPINENTHLSISAFLNTFLANEPTVSGFKEITAKQDSVEPRLFKITGKIKPVFTNEYMDVDFTFVASL